jgi:hypothetical protein
VSAVDTGGLVVIYLTHNESMKGRDIMGMTDKQFAGFLRQAIRTLTKALATNDENERKELIRGLLEDFQATLEG